MTVVYVDLLWLLNFVANHLLLLGAGRLAGAGLCRWRIALGAALGAWCSTALGLYTAAVACIPLMAALLMMRRES